MEKTIISTGKTIDAATEAALERLGLDRDSVSVEVLETPRSGFFGIGATPAKIKVTYEAPDEPEQAAPAPALSSASRNVKPSQFERLQAERQKAEEEKRTQAEQAARMAAQQLAQPAQPAQPAAPAPAAPAGGEPKPDRPAPRPRPARDNPRSGSRGERDNRPARAPRQPAPTPAPRPAQPLPPYTPPEAGSMEERIETYLNGLMERMGSDARAQAVRVDDERYHVNLVGEKLGMLIGRRGETLDAIQHLTNYAVGRGESRHLRVTVDAEGYRAKREESLEHLAYKVAAKVIRMRRNWTMEPMNAYERHVIHAALQDYDGVSTYSTGTEPNRRVVVAYGNGRTAPEEE